MKLPHVLQCALYKSFMRTSKPRESKLWAIPPQSLHMGQSRAQHSQTWTLPLLRMRYVSHFPCDAPGNYWKIFAISYFTTMPSRNYHFRRLSWFSSCLISLQHLILLPIHLFTGLSFSLQNNTVPCSFGVSHSLTLSNLVCVCSTCSPFLSSSLPYH